MKAYSRLSAEERARIDELRNREGLGVRQIALRIGRDKFTVSREPRRGPRLASNENGVPSSLPAETLEGGRVDVEAVPFGDDRAAQGRTTRPPAAKARCVCSIESGPCERVESLQMSGRF